MNRQEDRYNLVQAMKRAVKEADRRREGRGKTEEGRRGEKGKR